MPAPSAASPTGRLRLQDDDLLLHTEVDSLPPSRDAARPCDDTRPRPNGQPHDIKVAAVAIGPRPPAAGFLNCRRSGHARGAARRWRPRCHWCLSHERRNTTRRRARRSRTSWKRRSGCRPRGFVGDVVEVALGVRRAVVIVGGTRPRGSRACRRSPRRRRRRPGSARSRPSSRRPASSGRCPRPAPLDHPRLARIADGVEVPCALM